MSAYKHRMNRIFAWGATGAGAVNIGLLLMGLAGRLLGIPVSGVWLYFGSISFFLLIVSLPLWFITWLAGWGKSPAGRFSRAARQGAQTGEMVLWTGIGLAGCALAILIAIRLLAHQSKLEEAVLAAGIGLFVGVVGNQALRVGLNLNRDPRRAGRIARTTSRALNILAIAIVVLGPAVSVVWTISTAIFMGEEWGWMALVAPITLVYPIIAGAGLAAVVGAIGLGFSFVGKKH